MKYTKQELDEAAIYDLAIDARTSREQAENGPYFPEIGITRESCIAYAEKCERSIERYKDGGAHAFVLGKESL